MAWLERFSPTPGRSARTSMPRSRNAPAAPMPERIRNAGECTPPAERMISRPRSPPPRHRGARGPPGGGAAANKKARRGGGLKDAKMAGGGPRRIEIADRGRCAFVRPVTHGNRAVAVAKIRIHVGDERDLPLLREG